MLKLAVVLAVAAFTCYLSVSAFPDRTFSPELVTADGGEPPADPICLPPTLCLPPSYTGTLLQRNRPSGLNTSLLNFDRKERSGLSRRS